MDMDIDFFSNLWSEGYEVDTVEEDTAEVDADYGNLDAEGERCGICMDIVVDRGILDCCQHWFCFACIDNWATITNLCPLCQNEFQLITCVPVFDTVVCGQNGEDSDSRDEWCAEGKKNAASFPSYYIDENAVICLDGDGCKIRSGSMRYEETLSLDTSIACDSCDIWYHAFCVGFHPQDTIVDSWFCPRCLTNETDRKADLKEMCSTGTNADPHHSVGMSLGKVSMSVTDAGERAFGVSRIDSEDVADEVEHPLLGNNCSSDEINRPFDKGVNSIKLDTTAALYKFRETSIKSEPDDSESGPSFDLDQPPGFGLSDGKANNLLGRNEFLHEASLDGNVEDLNVPRFGEKRKHQGSSFQPNDEDEHHICWPADPSSTKMVKVKRGTSSIYLNDPVDIAISAVLMTFRNGES